MQIKCCKCGKIYRARFYESDGSSMPFLECPHCGFMHVIEIRPVPFEAKQEDKKEIRMMDLASVYYADLGYTRIVSIDGSQSESSGDDQPVTGWTKTNEFIVELQIISSSKDTEASTYKLQWQDNNDGGGYSDLAATGEMNYGISDSSWNNGDTLGTSEMFVTQQDPSRQTGYKIKDASLSPSIDLADDTESALWFGVNSDDADDGHTYSFQLYSSAEGAALGIAAATISISGGMYYQAVGGGSVSITGTLAKKAKKLAGGYSMPITGSLIKKTEKPVGGYSVTIAGSLIKKTEKPVGGGVVNIAGTLIKKMFKAVGGYSMTITGDVATLKKLVKYVGGGTVTITGSLAKKTKKIVGGYSMTITGSLVKKMFKTVGSGVVNMTGTAIRKMFRSVGGGTVTSSGSLVKKTKKPVGGGTVTSSGSLARKIYKIVGGYSVTITGSLAKKVKKLVGGGSVSIVGTLEKFWIGIGGIILREILSIFSRIRKEINEDSLVTLLLDANSQITILIDERSKI